MAQLKSPWAANLTTAPPGGPACAHKAASGRRGYAPRGRDDVQRLVFQEEGKRILDEFGISAKEYSVGYYIADALETISTLLTVICKVAVDATGHDAEVCHIVVRKIGPKLRTKTGEVMGEKPMWAEKGEKEILKNTTEVYPGLVVAGMTANAVLGSPRMWAIFGGMLLSGKKAARVAMKLLKEG